MEKIENYICLKKYHPQWHQLLGVKLATMLTGLEIRFGPISRTFSPANIIFKKIKFICSTFFQGTVPQKSWSGWFIAIPFLPAK